MKTSIHILTAICAAALLAACGSGGSLPASSGAAPSPTPEPVPVPMPVQPAATSNVANLGVFVPSASTSVSFNLNDCRYTGATFTNVLAGNGNGTLEINANGNMTFIHAGDGGLALQPINTTINASTAYQAELQISAEAGNTSNRYLGYLLDSVGGTEISFGFNPDHDYVAFPGSSNTHGVRFDGNQGSLSCMFVSNSSMTANFGDFNARIASIVSGVNASQGAYPVATIANGFATWENGSNKYARINLSTGELSAGTTVNGTFTPANIASSLLPSNGNNSPRYEEKKEGSGYTIEFRENRNSRGTAIQGYLFNVAGGFDLRPTNYYD